MSGLEVISVGEETMGAPIRAFDWSATPLGPRGTWSAALTSIYEMMIASPFAMCAGWGPELTLIYNEAYADFLAARHPTALGRPIKEVWHDVWPDIEPLIERATAGEQVHHTDMHLVMTRKGYAEDTYWTFAYSALGDAEAVVGFLNVAIETTAGVLAGRRRDAAEADLRDLNATLERQVAERTRDRNLIWQVSRDLLAVTDGQGRLLRVNPAWARVLGWPEQDLVGRTSEWMEHPDDRAKTRDVTARLAGTPTGVTMENRMVGVDGGYRTLAWTAVPVEGQFYCSGRDVTEERLQTATLTEQTSQLRLYGDIVQASEAPICAFDAEYRLIAFNQAHNDEFFRVNGYHTRIGDVFPDLFVPEQGVVMRALMTRALTGESFTVVEEFGRPELGTPHWEISYTPLRDETGMVIGAFHLAQDISGRLRAEAELRGVQDALRQSQKMEAVGQLTGGLAHDFNNLLAGISGSLELIQSRMQQGRFNDVERYVAAARGAAKRAAALTHRLLAFSRRQTLDPKPTNVNSLISGMQEMIQRTVGPSIPVEVVGASGLWPALVDPSQLENALLNLCINARDAMPDGGRITVETANRWLDERAARQHDVPVGQYLSMCVTDTGIGMPPEVIARVFEPFFTTKPIGEGTGLDLSMIYGFAQQSGGQVRVYSEAGRGTTVCVSTCPATMAR